MSYSNVGIWAALPRTQRGQPIVLGSDPKGRRLVYAHGNSVIIRDLEDPSKSEVYTEHSVLVTCAKFSPSGFYICSGDQHGKVRIWDTVNPEHLLKAEYEPISGQIRDIVWSHDSQRICIVGEGRDKFAHVFMMDTGASVKGDLTGHTKAINTCDWKPTRPFRIATGGEDNKVAFYEGPPFTFKCTRSEHTRFVHCVRYAPNGEMFASGGFDGKVIIYSGLDAEVIKELGSPAHKGGVYAVSWSPHSKQLLTASGDKTCKVWDVETGSVTAEFVMGKEIEDQQLSCLWTSYGILVSVSLSGFINYFDLNSSGKPSKVIKGHNKPITRVAVTEDLNTLFTSAAHGTVIEWDIATGMSNRIEGTGHGAQVTGLLVKRDHVYTCGIDDSIKAIDPLKKCYSGLSISMGSQPRQIAALEDGIIAVAISEICIIRDDKKVGCFPLSYEGLCIAVSEGSDVAVGAADNKVHVYKLSGTTLNEIATLDHRGVVTDVSFSPDGNFLAACDSDRKVVVYNVPGYERYNKIEWGFHNARINCVAWSPNSRLVASGSLDTMIIVWSIDQPNKHIIIKRVP